MEEIKTVIDNTKDWYDLVDTGLKIGLGALIAGGFTYLTNKTNHSHESNKLQYELKKQLILETSELSAKYFLKINTLFLTWGSEPTKGKFIKDIPPEWENIYLENNLIYNTRKEEIEKIMSNLSLLGLEDVNNLLVKYDTFVLTVRNNISSGQLTFPQGNEEFFNEIHEIKKQYNLSISKYFRNLKIN